tara:strand:+ start:62 stop:556 length:495 start_codon:yes stop_codon:yes gene_type:complete
MWFDIVKIRPRRKKHVQPPNIFTGETNEDNNATLRRRVMGRGLMRDVNTKKLVPSTKENTPTGKHHLEDIKANKKLIPAKHARLGTQKAREGEVDSRGKNRIKEITPRWKHKRATKTMPQNRCAMCTKILFPQNRFTIDYGKDAEGKKLELSFCKSCAERMKNI